MKSRSEPSSLQEVFLKFSGLLSQSNYRVAVTKTQRCCEFCNSTLTESAYPLGCSHYICSTDCFSNLVTSQLGNRLSRYSNLRCPCEKLIPSENTKAIYGGEAKFKELLNKKNLENEPKHQCMICESTLPMNFFITFDCDHRYCHDCVQMSIDFLISEGKVGDEISCPECQSPLSYHIIMAVLDAETGQKYDRFLMRNFQGNPGEKFVMCIGKPGVNCDFGQLVSDVREDYKCPQCQARFCPKCRLDVHPKLTCEQQRANKAFEGSPFEEQLKAGLMKICPWCNSPIEKDAGCKYMTCPSEQCQKIRHFCWDCMAKLTKKHEEHKCVSKDVISNRIKRFFKNILFIS